MPYKNIGYQTILGAAKQSAYRTALVATDKIPYRTENLIGEYIRINSEWLGGHAGLVSNDKGPKKVMGSVAVDVVYDEKSGSEFVGTDLLFAAAMGTTVWDAVNTSNQITLSLDLDIALTLALLKGNVGTNALWEFNGVKSSGFTLEGVSGSNSNLKATFDYIVYNIARSSCINTSTDLTTLPTDIPGRVLFTDGSLRMSTDFSDALGNSDRISFNKFTLSLNNTPIDPDFASIDATHTDGSLILETLRNGFRDCKLSITLPRYDADTFFTAYEANSPIQLQLMYQSGTKKFNINCPYAVIEKITGNVSGPGIIPVEISLALLRGAAYNNGAGNTVMLFQDSATTISEEFAIETDNERTASIL